LNLQYKKQFLIHLFRFQKKMLHLQSKINNKNMGKISVVMSQREYKKFLAYKEADKVVKSIRRGLHEVQEAREGKRKLKSAYDLVHEL